jgi:soluble lytic murein transglycosylase-like protein
MEVTGMLASSLLKRRFAVARARQTDRLAMGQAAHGRAPARRIVRVLRRSLEWIGAASVVAVVALAMLPGNRLVLAQLATGLAAYLQSEDAGPAATSLAASPGSAVAPTLGQAVDLNPSSTFVAAYLAHRYHVADDAVRAVVATANAEGAQRHVDPLLILAVVAVESSLNPFAQSSVGATGLMQVMPGLHRSKFSPFRRDPGPLDPLANIRAGTQILADLIERGGSVERGLQLYVGAGNLGGDNGYAARVFAELTHLRQAASGQVAGALAAAVRADQAKAAEPHPVELAQNS